MENVVHQLLVVNRAKERMNKFRKKIANGDISSPENFFECCAFGLKGVPQIAFLDDPTRKASMHDVNLSEVRELVLGLLGKRILVPRYFKLKNAPFVRQVVHVHIGHVPAAINPNTTLSRGGPSALVTGLALSDVKCVRVDREIDEQGALPYKFLTVPYSKHFELALPNTTEPAPAVTTSTNAATASTGAADVNAALTEEQQAAHTLAPYVLTPAQLHLWDYPSMLLVTETMKSINSDCAAETTESEDAQPSKRARLDPEATATTAVEASSTVHGPTVGIFSGAEYIPTASEAQQILNKLGYSSWVAASATSTITSITPHTPVLVAAIDCEMCDTAQGSELTRISVLSFEGAVLLDTLVMPPRAIVNYQTQYSGITEEMLKGVTVTLEQVQVALLRLFTPATILIGHSLDSDLRALRLVHNRCVDTALIYPHPRGFPMRLKLKKLAEDYLQLRIQNNTAKGHDSTEDAKAALQLALLKGANGPLFGVKNPDQQRFPLMSVLDPVSTDAVLLWVGEKAIEKTLEKAIKSNMIGDDSCIVRTAISVREEEEKVEENSDSVAAPAPAAGALGAPITASVATPVDTPAVSSCGPDSCTGGTARTQQVTSNAAAVAALCAQLAAPVCAGDCYTVHTTEDKSLGPISSWVASPHTGNNNIQSVTVPKRKYLFANLKYPQATEYDEFASELHAQIDAIRATIAAADAVQGYLPGTLLVVTAQETHAPVVALIQRKRVLSRATMAAAMWSAEDEMKLKEMRKHNLAFMAAAVV